MCVAYYFYVVFRFHFTLRFTLYKKMEHVGKHFVIYVGRDCDRIKTICFNE